MGIIMKSHYQPTEDPIRDKSKFSLHIKDIAVIGMMSAILIATFLVIGFLPNIELVSLLIILYTLVFGWKAIFIIYTFVLVDGIIYGFGLNWVLYLYVWLILFLIARLFKNLRSPFYWGIISGLFGLFFGAFDSLIYVVIGGVNTGIAHWVAGIGYDVLHCIGNFITALLLFKPLYNILDRLNKQFLLNE